uniref:hypothetical protein n=1 Tax=Gemmiger formicilis TaxID=745368 RepID=UPI00402740E8
EGKAVPNCPTKKPNRFKTVGHLYKTHFENRSSTLLILCDTTKKKACDILCHRQLVRRKGLEPPTF